MELYLKTSYELAEKLTRRYSTSFSMSSRLFDRTMRKHIYAIYGLVRIADEIVDTYKGDDAQSRLDELYMEVLRAIDTRYSTNPVVHAFADTASKFAIDKMLITPFFDSMGMDITFEDLDQEKYERYIYGSAEVVGLMCLKVFVGGDQKRYDALSPGARSLGAAYQKVNFLRDLRADHHELGRMYFPGVDYDMFDEQTKKRIIRDIQQDFSKAKLAIDELPTSARSAVRASYYYYTALLHKLQQASAQDIASRRIRVSTARKLLLLARAVVGL